MKNLEMAHRAVLKFFEINRESFLIRPALVDLADDLVAGILLSQILYWFSCPKGSQLPRVRIFKHGHYWLSKAYDQWWEECRITQKQAKRGLQLLKAKGLIETRLMKFDGAPTCHISICWETLLSQLKAIPQLENEQSEADTPSRAEFIEPSGDIGFGPKVPIEFAQRANSLTEITSENTTSITTRAAGAGNVAGVDSFQGEETSAPGDASAQEHNILPEEQTANAADVLQLWKSAIPGDYAFAEEDQAASSEIISTSLKLNYSLELILKRLFGVACKREWTSIAQSWEYFTGYFLEWEIDGLKELGKHFPSTMEERRAARFIGRWKDNFLDVFKRNTLLNNSDKQAALGYFSNEDSEDEFHVATIAKEAWETANGSTRAPGFDKYFACRKAILMRDFFMHFEKIQAELGT